MCFSKSAMCLVHVAPVLREVGDLDVLLQLAVLRVLLAVALDDVLARRAVLGVVGQDLLQYLDGGVPVLLLLVVGDERGEEGGGPLPADGARNPPLDVEEEVDVLRAQVDELVPQLLHAGELLLVDEAVDGLLVVVDRGREVPRLLPLLSEDLDDVRFLVVHADEAVPDLQLLRLVVSVLVALPEGAQRVLVLPVFEDPLRQVLHDVPLVVVHEDADQHDQVGVVDQLPGKGKHPGEVQGDDGVARVLEVLAGQLPHLLRDPFGARLLDERVEVLEVRDRVAVQRRPGPLLLIQKIRDRLQQFRCHSLLLLRQNHSSYVVYSLCTRGSRSRIFSSTSSMRSRCSPVGKVVVDQPEVAVDEPRHHQLAPGPGAELLFQLVDGLLELSELQRLHLPPHVEHPPDGSVHGDPFVEGRAGEPHLAQLAPPAA